MTAHGNGTARDISDDSTQPAMLRVAALEGKVEEIEEEHRAAHKEARATRGEVRDIAISQRAQSDAVHELAACVKENTLAMQNQLRVIGSLTTTNDGMRGELKDAVAAMKTARGLTRAQSWLVTLGVLFGALIGSGSLAWMAWHAAHATGGG